MVIDPILLIGQYTTQNHRKQNNHLLKHNNNHTQIPFLNGITISKKENHMNVKIDKQGQRYRRNVWKNIINKAAIFLTATF